MPQQMYEPGTRRIGFSWDPISMDCIKKQKHMSIESDLVRFWDCWLLNEYQAACASVVLTSYWELHLHHTLWCVTYARIRSQFEHHHCLFEFQHLILCCIIFDNVVKSRNLFYFWNCGKLSWVQNHMMDFHKTSSFRRHSGEYIGRHLLCLKWWTGRLLVYRSVLVRSLIS